MCAEADRLRSVLYSLSTQYADIAIPLQQAIKDAIVMQRDDPEYQQALENLRQHIRECETCRKSYQAE